MPPRDVITRSQVVDHLSILPSLGQRCAFRKQRLVQWPALQPWVASCIDWDCTTQFYRTGIITSHEHPWSSVNIYWYQSGFDGNVWGFDRCSGTKNQKKNFEWCDWVAEVGHDGHDSRNGYNLIGSHGTVLYIFSTYPIGCMTIFAYI